MLFNKKFGGSAYIDFAKCTLVCALTLPIVSFIGAVIANSLADPTASIGMVSLSSLIVSAVICGAVCIKISDKKMKVPLLCALFITLVMMLIGLIINRGALPSSAVMNYLCYFGIFAFSALILKGKGGKRVRKSFKRR